MCMETPLKHVTGGLILYLALFSVTLHSTSNQLFWFSICPHHFSPLPCFCWTLLNEISSFGISIFALTFNTSLGGLLLYHKDNKGGLRTHKPMPPQWQQDRWMSILFQASRVGVVAHISTLQASQRSVRMALGLEKPCPRSLPPLYTEKLHMIPLGFSGFSLRCLL